MDFGIFAMDGTNMGAGLPKVHREHTDLSF
jgi:hypothetical protein